MTMLLNRETYLEQIRPFFQSDLIKALVGIQRTGKSTLLKIIVNELLSSGVDDKNIIFIDLEELTNAKHYDIFSLNEYIEGMIIDNNKYFIFLDEIQKIPDFEKLISSLRVSNNCSIFVSSNASSITKGKYATLLVGRFVEFVINPFSYLETIQFQNKEANKQTLDEYMELGGFPGRFVLTNHDDTAEYLRSILDSILDTYILPKTKKNQVLIYNIIKYIFQSTGTYISSTQITNHFNSSLNQIIIPYKTIEHVLENLERSFLIHKAEIYDINDKIILDDLHKYYLTDLSLRMIYKEYEELPKEMLLENLIYNELLAMNYTVYICRVGNKDIDFIAFKNNKKCFIQAAYYIIDDKVKEQEFDIYKVLEDSSPRYVISLDTILINYDGVININIIDFLTHKVTLFTT
jgi:predicted AAA+ superfamily ATPase